MRTCSCTTTQINDYSEIPPPEHALENGQVIVFCEPISLTNTYSSEPWEHQNDAWKLFRIGIIVESVHDRYHSRPVYLFTFLWEHGKVSMPCAFYCKFLSLVFEWKLVYDITIQSNLSICLSLGAWTGLGDIKIIVQCAYDCKLKCSQSCI